MKESKEDITLSDDHLFQLAIPNHDLESLQNYILHWGTGSI